MKTIRTRLTGLFALLLLALSASAHDVPMSNLALHLGNSGITVSAHLPWTGLSTDIPELGPAAKTAAEDGAKRVETHRVRIAELIVSRLALKADETILTNPETGAITLNEARDAVTLELTYPYRDASGAAIAPPQNLAVTARLFPTDPKHKTLLKIYRGRDGATMEREELLNLLSTEVTHTVGGGQSPLSIIRQFIREGIHHIFIGPDHILFIIGLLLAGGTYTQILKIVTGFTLAHSITLALAVLGIVSPSPQFVEPIIALSIVFVGLNVLRPYVVRKKSREILPETPEEKRNSLPDRRLVFAFGFGLIHGFGFAGVMTELDLPRYALGWSLVSFNIGVEIGQACIVLLTLPILVLLARWNAQVGRITILLGAIGVTLAGAYWFIERVFLGG
jgi:hypothetical protein